MQGEATTYVRVLTDCLEMYAKELSILSNLHTDTLLDTMQSSKLIDGDRFWRVS